MNKKQIAQERAVQLKERIQDYLDVKDTMPKGMDPAQQEKAEEKKRKILDHLQGTESDWNDYKWQLKNRISDV